MNIIACNPHYLVSKDGMGCKAAGEHIAKKRLKHVSTGICHVKFFNGYFVGLKVKGRMRPFTDNEWIQYCHRVKKVLAVKRKRSENEF